MANVSNSFLKQIIQGDQIHDYDHASKVFLSNNYELLPKNAFLFHVYFKLNTGVKPLNGLNDSTSGSVSGVKNAELGMMVKQVSLPKFTVDSKILNAYNRPNIVQTKIHYDPVNIIFHDDSADLVRNFWYDYYSYYYRDSDYGGGGSTDPMTYIHDELIDQRKQKDWGYTIRGTQNGISIKTPYLNSIEIYSLHNKKFSQYTLVNPIIKSFQHGEHNSSGYTDILQHQMVVEFESVLYSQGSISSNTVNGFGDIHYDKNPSPLNPISGGTHSILGPGGIVNSASDIVTDLNSGNLATALFTGARVTNGLRGANLGTMAKTEAISLTKGVLTGNNPFGTVAIPSVSGLLSGFGGKATAPGITPANQTATTGLNIPASTAQGT